MLKKFVSLFLLLILADHTTAQTREETEAWIIKQTEVNPSELKHSIEGDELVSHTELAGAGMSGSGSVQKAIPLSRVTTVAYTHTSDYLSYSLTCDSPCAYTLQDPAKKRPKFLFELYGKFDASYVPRMNSALVHLVKLHGGRARVVRAEIPKPAF
jgi:hypothetical protein